MTRSHTFSHAWRERSRRRTSSEIAKKCPIAELSAYENYSHNTEFVWEVKRAIENSVRKLSAYLLRVLIGSLECLFAL